MSTSIIGELPRRSFSIENTLKREFQRQILVRTDQPLRGALEASIACGISFGDIYQTQSTPGGEYEYDSGAEAYKFSAAPLDPENDMTCWVITVDYSNQPLDPTYYTAGQGSGLGTQGGGGDGGQNESPLLEPAKIVWGKKSRTRALYKALNIPETAFANKFVNTAGDPFTKVPEIDEGVLSLTITRNESTFDAPLMQEFWMTVNSFPFYGFLEYSVLCESITGFRDYRNKTQFWPVTYQFLIDARYRGWNWKPVSKGPRYIDGADGLTHDALTLVGRPREVYLAEDGTLLPDGTDPFEQDFVIYDEADFGDLGLE